jgi:hypothetical protein
MEGRLATGFAEPPSEFSGRTLRGFSGLKIFSGLHWRELAANEIASVPDGAGFLLPHPDPDHLGRGPTLCQRRPRPDTPRLHRELTVLWREKENCECPPCPSQAYDYRSWGARMMPRVSLDRPSGCHLHVITLLLARGRLPLSKREKENVELANH